MSKSASASALSRVKLCRAIHASIIVDCILIGYAGIPNTMRHFIFETPNDLLITLQSDECTKLNTSFFRLVLVVVETLVSGTLLPCLVQGI
jgi:hypothetical protein